MNHPLKDLTDLSNQETITKLNGELAILKSEESIEEYQILATISGWSKKKIDKFILILS